VDGLLAGAAHAVEGHGRDRDREPGQQHPQPADVGPLFAGGLLAGGSGSAAVLLAIVPFVVVGGGAAFALTWRKQCSE